MTIVNFDDFIPYSDEASAAFGVMFDAHPATSFGILIITAASIESEFAELKDSFTSTRYGI